MPPPLAAATAPRLQYTEPTRAGARRAAGPGRARAEKTECRSGSGRARAGATRARAGPGPQKLTRFQLSQVIGAGLYMLYNYA